MEHFGGPEGHRSTEHERERINKSKTSDKYFNKWVVLISLLCIFGFTVLIFSEYGTDITWKRIQRSVNWYRNEEPASNQGKTTFHVIQDDYSQNRRRRALGLTIGRDEDAKEANDGTGARITPDTSVSGMSGSGDASGDASSGGSGTESESGSGDVTTGPGEIEQTTMESPEETTAAEPEDGSGETSGFGPTGTTAEGSAFPATTDMFEPSGDDEATTAEFSGLPPTDEPNPAVQPSPISMLETDKLGPFAICSQPATPQPDTTAAIETDVPGRVDPEVTTDDFHQDESGSGPTTGFVISTDAATEFEVTTAGDGEEPVPTWVFIVVAGVGGLLLGVFLVLICQSLMGILRRRKAVTPLVTPSPSQSHMRDDDKPPELSWLMTREDMLMRAMALGNIQVLDFAIAEARTTGMMSDNPQLMKEAETKLNQWKRTKSQLEGAYKARDIVMMEEFMGRFDELQMKDDSGIYQKCVDLQWDRTHSKLNMKSAADARDEAALTSTMKEFESLKLPEGDMANDPDYQRARQVLEEIRQEKLLQGQTHDELRNMLRGAVFAMDAALITKAIDTFTKAEVPDDHGDIAKANRALEQMEADRQSNLDLSRKKRDEASYARDQDTLRQSIEDCRKYGASEEELRAHEKLLRVIEREDELVSEIQGLAEMEDMAKLAPAIAMFRNPVSEMVDKSGHVAKAEEVLERLQQKEKMRKTKNEVTWRLQNAMAIGDVMAMDSMIKALKGLAAAGEEVDEPFLLRAGMQLEASRGQVDYRKRMEAIKSAIPRTVALENISQLEDLVDQMSILAEDEKYTMTADDSRVLDESRATLNNLKNKKAILDEMAIVKPNLTLPLIPQNLAKLKESIDRMTETKKAASEFDDVFTEEDSNLLEEAKYNVEVLEEKVEVMTNARERLDTAVEAREYPELKRAIRNAIQAPFIQKQELIEPRKLAVFLDPKARRIAVKASMRARDIRMLEVALHDFKDARVEDENLLLKAERTLDKLHKREKRRKKQERRQDREDAKRQADIQRLTSILQSAIDSQDTDHLQLALEEFEESGYDEDDIPLATNAEELFDNLKIKDLRERLLDAIKRRDLSGLENAIDDADYGGYVMDVKEEYDVAKDLLYHLRELKRLREAIAEMNRSLISEIHKYPTPPAPVHQVMTAAFILLGESPNKMKNWHEVQAMLGKLGQNAITRRVRVCVPGDIPTAAVKKAEQHIRNLNLDEVAEISKGAATFYAWSTCMIKEHSQVSSDDALAELEIPDIGYNDDGTPSKADRSWTERNA